MGRPPIPAEERGRRINIYLRPDVEAVLVALAKERFEENWSEAISAAILALAKRKKPRT